MLRNRFLRRGYWLMNAEVEFKRKTFNCTDRELLMRFAPVCTHVSLVIVNDYGIAVVKTILLMKQPGLMNNLVTDN